MTTVELQDEFKQLAINLEPDTTRRTDIDRELNKRLVLAASTASINALDQNEKEALFIVLKQDLGK